MQRSNAKYRVQRAPKSKPATVSNMLAIAATLKAPLEATAHALKDDGQ